MNLFIFPGTKHIDVVKEMIVNVSLKENPVIKYNLELREVYVALEVQHVFQQEEIYYERNNPQLSPWQLFGPGMSPPDAWAPIS